MVIREATIKDLPRLLEIYNEVVRSSAATFDLEEQTMEQRAEWFAHYGGRGIP
jgi:phosphinothricin acetyltransferase